MSEELILPFVGSRKIRLPPSAKCTKSSECTKEDFVNAQTYFALEATSKAQAKRSFCVQKELIITSISVLTLVPLQITRI
jgi:hypothetical protein